VKYTFLSKWTVLIMTVLTAGLIVFGIIDFQSHAGYALLAFLGGVVVYALSWIIALLDAIQERSWFWVILLLVLLPIVIGPLLYAFGGPKNTK
jgi:hypothetical protein